MEDGLSVDHVRAIKAIMNGALSPGALLMGVPRREKKQASKIYPLLIFSVLSPINLE